MMTWLETGSGLHSVSESQKNDMKLPPGQQVIRKSEPHFFVTIPLYD